MHLNSNHKRASDKVITDIDGIWSIEYGCLSKPVGGMNLGLAAPEATSDLSHDIKPNIMNKAFTAVILFLFSHPSPLIRSQLNPSACVSKLPSIADSKLQRLDDQTPSAYMYPDPNSFDSTLQRLDDQISQDS